MYRYDWLLVKREREAAGLTQRDAAAGAGMSIRQWQKYENNEAVPSINNFLKICLSLGVDPAALLRDD